MTEAERAMFEMRGLVTFAWCRSGRLAIVDLHKLGTFDRTDFHPAIRYTLSGGDGM